MTRTNKIFSVTTAGLVIAILATSQFVHAADLNQAATNLSADDEWSIMAHAALGQTMGQTFLRTPISSGSATDYEKRILAITAIGQNPRTYASEDLIAKLESFFNNNQLGDTTLLNDDIFGILALKSAGISDNVVDGSRQFILSHQNSDSGWGYGTNVASDSNTTAMAIGALSLTGDVPNSAYDYISSTEDNSSGGYGFTKGMAADGASTAWVMMGFNTAGKNIPSKAKTFLESLQTSSGSFKWKPTDTTGSNLITAYAIIALSGHGIPIKITAANATTPIAPSIPAPIPAQSNSSSNSALPTFSTSPAAVQSLTTSCMVPIFHTNFAFPREGGSITKVGNQLYFVPVDCKGTGSPVNVGQANTANSTATNNSSNNQSSANPSGLIESCLVPIFHTNFAYPSEGGRIAKIGNQMYFVPVGCNPGTNATILPASNNPVSTTTAASSTLATKIIQLKISYFSTVIFQGPITISDDSNALSILTAASQQNHFAVDIKNSSLGSYVFGIAGHQALGNSGWLYAVNGQVPNLPAANYSLHNQDVLVWYYGQPGSAPY